MLTLISPQPSKQASFQPSADTELRQTPTEATTDIDYFEKFTLVDVVVPGEQAPLLEGEVEQPVVKSQPKEQKPAKEVATDSLSASDDSFVFVTDMDIVGEHLDEVFYGEGASADTLHQRLEDKEEGRGGMRSRRESQRSTKENGAVLFGSEETTLTPIFISPGPPKIIDPILLEEPTAMSFMYSDLYEDAMGERKKSDEEYSEAESVASEKSYKRRFSDSEEGGGYLEKFILKDETSTVEVQLETLADRREGRMMWAQSDFEMTGCLKRAVEEEGVDEEKTMTEELKIWETDVRERSKQLHSAVCEDKLEILAEADRERDKTETKPPVVSQEEPVREDSVKESKPLKENKEEQQVKPPESSTEKPEIPLMVTKAEESEGQQREEDKVCKQNSAEPEQPRETKTVAEKLNEVLTEITDGAVVTESVSSEVPTKSETHSEPECGLSEEAAADTEMAAADGKILTETSPEEKEPERQETLTSTAPPAAMDTSAGTSVCEENGAAAVKFVSEDCAPVEVITDYDFAVHTVVEVTETAVNEKKTQTQVQIDFQEVTGAETTDVQKAEKESLPEETAADNKLPQIIIPEVAASEQEAEVKCEISKHTIKPEELDTESEKKQKADSESANTATVVQDIVNVGDELILLVPKGKAVEMDIQIGQWSEKTDEDTAAEPEPESICDLPAPVEETQEEPQIDREPEVAVKEEVELPREPSPPPPVEEIDLEEQKTEQVLEENKVSSSLRSFTAQEDLSALNGEDTQPQETTVDQTAETMEDAPETDIGKEDVVPFIHLQEEDVEQKMELGQVVPETPEVPADELGFEVISEQDANQIPEPETLRNEKEPKPEAKMEVKTEEKQVKEKREEKREAEESEMEVKREDKMEVQKKEGEEMKENTEEKMEVERKEMEMEVMREDEMKVEDRDEKMEVEKVDLFPEEEPIEADYEIIDAEEESEARLAAELEGMDWFCHTCECLLAEDDCVSGEHHSHEVKPVDTAYEEIKVMCCRH